jgi:3-oxoacyl-[acyl-carrier protein] reductase
MQKTIIITGASRGIGLELVKILSENHRIIALSRNIESVKNLPHVEAYSVDFLDPTFVEKLDFKAFGKVDAVIHNAGKLINKPFEKLTHSDFLEVYQVNVFAVVLLSQALLPHLQKGSHVVNISSMGGIQGSSKFPGLAAYSSSKGALITLTEMLAEEYKESNISFNALALGAVQTEMLAEAFPGYQASTTAREMARFIADFALNGHQFFNGKVLPVAHSTP